MNPSPDRINYLGEGKKKNKREKVGKIFAVLNSKAPGWATSRFGSGIFPCGRCRFSHRCWDVLIPPSFPEGIPGSAGDSPPPAWSWRRWGEEVSAAQGGFRCEPALCWWAASAGDERVGVHVVEEEELGASGEAQAELEETKDKS